MDIKDKLKILGETTADDFPNASIEQFCMEGCERIEELESQLVRQGEIGSLIIPPKLLAKIKADAIRNMVNEDDVDKWSCMGTFAITVDDILEYADKLQGIKE